MKQNGKLNLKLLVILTALLLSHSSLPIYSKSNININEKQIYLNNFRHLNIAPHHAKNLNLLKKVIQEKKPKALYLEQWILAEKGNENLLKDLRKIAKKNKIKLFLFIGRNTWFGQRGAANTIASLDLYGKHIDGLVLRTQPHRINIWKEDDIQTHAEILNLMLDSYANIYRETQKRDKLFIAEFPFWYSDYIGLGKSFSETACQYADKVYFLIDDLDKLETLDIPWNNVNCSYSINLTKKGIGKTIESINNIYERVKSKLTFYSNFQGFVIDSDSKLQLQ